MSLKITYKGTSMVVPFDYRCPECGHTCSIDHKRHEDMAHRKCPKKKCKGTLRRHIHTAPMLDADYHESRKYHNIGWEQ